MTVEALMRMLACYPMEARMRVCDGRLVIFRRHAAPIFLCERLQ
jgi:hypothetical protein